MSMQQPADRQELVELEPERPVWERFFTVAPLVLIGSRDEGGDYNFAPKHMSLQLGWDNFFGFVCTPRHTTYRNIQREEAFTVSYPRPSQLVLASLAAAPREGDCSKPGLSSLPTAPAKRIDGAFIRDAYVQLECTLDRTVDGFGENSFVAGKIVAARADEEFLRRYEKGHDHSQVVYRSPLLAYLHPGRFACIEQSFSFPFPAEFQK